MIARPAHLAVFWIVIAVPSSFINAWADSAGSGPGSSSSAAEVSADVRHTWEDDYASLKAALSKRDNRYALLRTGEERKDVAHIQSLLWESDRTPADVVLRRTAALLEHLKGMPEAPPLGALQEQLAAVRSRNTGAADDKEIYLAARAIGRAVALANPRLDFDQLIFNRWSSIPCHQEKGEPPFSFEYNLPAPTFPDPHGKSKLSDYCYWFDASNNNDGLGPYGGYRSTPLQFGFAHSRLGKALLATHAERVELEDLRRIMLWLDLNAMRLGTPTLDEAEQRVQETGEGTYQWPPEMDPKNPTGVEWDRPLPGLTESRPAEVMFSGAAAAGQLPGNHPLQ